MSAPEVAPKTPATQPAARAEGGQVVAQADHRASTATARSLQRAIQNSPRLVAQRQLQADLDNSPRQVAQRKAQPQPAANRTGLPDQLKTGAETLSGYSLDDVRVHRNSAKPAQLQAHAYAQGADIHLAPGQEQHLPHETWHVVQQKQGRVQPTTQLKGQHLNDNNALEGEATRMGAAALQVAASPVTNLTDAPLRNAARPVQRYVKQGDYHIAEDGGAAVKDEENTKELYAKNAHLKMAQEKLEKANSPIQLEDEGETALSQPSLAGLHKIGVGLRPSHEEERLEEGVMPKLSPQGKVLLPAECEKGAIAIIGKYTEVTRVSGNSGGIFNYAAHKHADARIANMVAQLPPEKQKHYYDNWQTGESIVTILASAHNSATRNKGTAVLTKLQYEFLQNYFDQVSDLQGLFSEDATDAQKVSTAGHDKEEVLSILERCITAADKKLNEWETEIMSEKSPAFEDLQAGFLAKSELINQLVSLYKAASFPEGIIRDALSATGKSTELVKYFGEESIAGNFSNHLSFFKQSRMESFLSAVVLELQTQLQQLAADRDDRFGEGDEQNEKADPKVGQSYGMVGGGFQLGERKGRWNWHWAAVIMQTRADNITMEAHASKKENGETHNDKWDFKMYGRPREFSDFRYDPKQTFHGRWKGQGFGARPVTVVGRPRQVAVVSPSSSSAPSRAPLESKEEEMAEGKLQERNLIVAGNAEEKPMVEKPVAAEKEEKTAVLEDSVVPSEETDKLV